MNKKITVVSGVNLDELPSAPKMIRYLEGFYCRHGETGLRALMKELSPEVLAVLFLGAWDYDARHPEATPSSRHSACEEVAHG